MIRKYCKAYYVSDLRAFSGWQEKRAESEPELTDTDVIYLWDDFTVVRSPVIPDRGLVFDEVTPQWQEFCREQLGFEIPEDLRYAYQEQEPEGAAAEPVAQVTES